MNTVISSMDKNYSLCDTRVTELKLILYMPSLLMYTLLLIQRRYSLTG